MRSGFFVFALIRPDQVDIWDQVTLCASGCNPDRMKQLLPRLPLVRRDKRLFYVLKEKEFILRKEEKKMKKIYFDIHRDLLNASGERCADEPMMNDTSK